MGDYPMTKGQNDVECVYMVLMVSFLSSLQTDSGAFNRMREWISVDTGVPQVSGSPG